MVQLITEQQKTDFENDGIVKLPNAIDDKLLAKLIECFEWSIANPGPIAVGKPEEKTSTSSITETLKPIKCTATLF